MATNDKGTEAARFIIFSLPRCGSTTLARALNCYPGIRCALEPFIPDNQDSRKNEISNAEALEQALAGIWRSYNGIKHVWYPNWPFGKALDLNRALVQRPDVKIIFLTRRNELRRLVSTEMSWQTNVWGKYTEADRERARGYDYQQLSTVQIEHQLQSVASGISFLKDAIRAAGTSVLELQYEDLLADHVFLADRLQLLSRLREFIDAPTPCDAQADFAVARLLDPVMNKLNLPDTYQRIPNIAEIEQRFGSDESGWLFK
jgi:LPS sulfotransferase NodH